MQATAVFTPPTTAVPLQVAITLNGGAQITTLTLVSNSPGLTGCIPLPVPRRLRCEWTSGAGGPQTLTVSINPVGTGSLRCRRTVGPQADLVQLDSSPFAILPEGVTTMPTTTVAPTTTLAPTTPTTAPTTPTSAPPPRRAPRSHRPVPQSHRPVPPRPPIQEPCRRPAGRTPVHSSRWWFSLWALSCSSLPGGSARRSRPRGGTHDDSNLAPCCGPCNRLGRARPS